MTDKTTAKAYKCGQCQQILEFSPPTYCETCEQSATCFLPGPEWIRLGYPYHQNCLREPGHTGPCSPMWHTIFSPQEVLKFSFESWDHEQSKPRVVTIKKGAV